MKTKRPYLSTTNMKLGNKIASWSISHKSCIGHTGYCRKHCYGNYGNLNYPKCVEGREWRYEESIKDSFIENIVTEIRNNKYKVVRVHVVGDFYDVWYIVKWFGIALHCPDTTFYAYTRAWRVPEMLPFLEELRTLNNFILYASTDPESGNITPKGWPVADLGEYNTYNFKECTSKCELCDWCYRQKGNVYFKLRKVGQRKK